jgi:hypothetical protein
VVQGVRCPVAGKQVVKLPAWHCLPVLIPDACSLLLVGRKRHMGVAARGPMHATLEYSWLCC